jgi:DMSO/TMAO reductase YedYZ molybdopterin-dependent catalytic subunit
MLGRRPFLGTLAAALTTGIARRAFADESLLRYGGTPQQLATPLELFDRLITPTPAFFVRSHFGPPRLDAARKVSIEGMVKTPLALTAADLKSFPEVTLTAVLQCAGNGRSLIRPRVPGVQWAHGAMGQATWTGVRLRDVLAKAGVASAAEGAAHVQIAGSDLPPLPTVPAFIRSIPLARALDPSTLIATRMNGEPLTLAHGAPMRLIVPGWAGDHWMKWLSTVRVQKEEAAGFFMQTAYRYPEKPGEPGVAVPPEQMKPLHVVPIKSVIARPSAAAKVPLGPIEIVGVAFSGAASIASVEVSVDGGKTWQRAALEGEPGPGRWQVYRHTFTPSAGGRFTAMARATDAKKNTQPERGVWNPSGYFWNGWHAVDFEVAS